MSEPLHHAAINTLRLVHAPLSNQEADWLSKDEKFREFVKSSKLYMIAQREGLEFSNVSHSGDGESTELAFDIVGHSISVKNLKLPLAQFFDELGDEFNVGRGPKVLNFENPKTGQRIWFTIEKLLHHFSRADIKLTAPDDYLKALTFDLLYVGISKNSDSLSRLFDQGHKARAKILSNESQKNPASRLTDELFIFLFDVEDLQIKTFSPNSDFEEALDGKPFEKKNLISDAEKAFVHILNTRYNTQSYKNYPKCLDGLADTGVKRYSYAIAENLTFKVGAKQFRGNFEPKLEWIDLHRADIIAVAADKAMLVKCDEESKGFPE